MNAAGHEPRDASRQARSDSRPAAHSLRQTRYYEQAGPDSLPRVQIVGDATCPCGCNHQDGRPCCGCTCGSGWPCACCSATDDHLAEPDPEPIRAEGDRCCTDGLVCCCNVKTCTCSCSGCMC